MLLEPHLREMTLKSLGDLKLVHDQKGGHASYRPLRMGAMVEKSYREPPYRKYREATELKSMEGDFQLDTRGIFPDDAVYYNGHFQWKPVFKGRKLSASGCETRFWGLTRNNQWIKIEFVERYFDQARHAGHDERSERRSEVVKLVVSETTPEEICKFCGITPKWIWQRLGDSVESWLKHRQDLLASPERLAEIIKQEKMLLDIIA